MEETGDGHDGVVPVDVRLVLLGMSDVVINEQGLVGLPWGNWLFDEELRLFSIKKKKKDKPNKN